MKRKLSGASRWRDDTVVPTEMHEGEETEQTVVIGIKIAILERYVLGIPQGIDELTALVVAAHHGCSRQSRYQPYAVAQLSETSSLQDFIVLWHGAIHTVLVVILVYTLCVEEVLYALGIATLPLSVGATPLIVQSDVHRHTPGIVAEVVAAIAPSSKALHERTVVSTHVGIESCLGMDGLVKEFPRLDRTVHPVIGAPIIGPLRPHLIECRYMVGRIGETLSEAIWREGDQPCLRVDEITLLGSLLLRKISEFVEELRRSREV